MKTSLYFLFRVMTVVCLPSLLFVLIKGTPETMVRFFPDDAFYYLQVAWNFSREGIVSFDGINTTTGFHPLWMVISAMGMLFLNKALALPMVFLFNSIAFAVGLFALMRLFEEKKQSGDLGLVALLTFPIFTFYIYTNSGMESALLVLCYCVFFSFYAHAIECMKISSKESFLIGILAGLVALSRLDAVIVLAGFGIYFFVLQVQKRQWRTLVLASIGTLVVLLPYFIWMHQIQGTLVPISSVAKYGRERWTLTEILRSLTGGNILGYALLLFSPVINGFSLFLRTPIFSSRFVQTIKISAFSGLIYWGYVVFISHEPYRWYLNLPNIIAVINLMWIYYAFSLAKYNRPKIVVPVFMALNVVFLFAWARMETTSYHLYKMTQVLNEKLPSTTVLATNDAGVVGYFANMKVHNLDGLVNSLENWNSYLKTASYGPYFEKYKVDYMLVRTEFLQRENIRDAKIYPSKEEGCEHIFVNRFGEQSLCRVSPN